MFYLAISIQLLFQKADLSFKVPYDPTGLFVTLEMEGRVECTALQNAHAMSSLHFLANVTQLFSAYRKVCFLCIV